MRACLLRRAFVLVISSTRAFFLARLVLALLRLAALLAVLLVSLFLASKRRRATGWGTGSPAT